MPHEVSGGKGNSNRQIQKWWTKTEWTEEHYKVARRLARSLPPVRSAAWDYEDTVQEIALRYQEKIQQRTGNKPNAWLRALLYNQNVSAYRKEYEIRGHRAEGNRPKEFVDVDGLANPPAPAHICSDSNELLCRYFREGEGSPITEQCLEHLRACASCAGLLHYVDLEFHGFLHHAADQVIQPRFVRLMDVLGMRNCARQFLRNVRRSIVADLQRYESLSRSNRNLQAGLLRLGEALPIIDRSLELMRTLPRKCKRNLGIRRGTLVQTFVLTQTDVWRLHLFLLATRSLSCKTVLSSYQDWLGHDWNGG